MSVDLRQQLLDLSVRVREMHDDCMSSDWFADELDALVRAASPPAPEDVIQLWDRISAWHLSGGGWDVATMAAFIENLIAELDALDDLADQVATDAGDIVGNARGLLMNLSSGRSAGPPPQGKPMNLDNLQRAFDALTIAEVRRYNGIPALSAEDLALREAIAELLESARGDAARVPPSQEKSNA